MTENNVHLWVRAEQRDNEARVGLTPEGAAKLINEGMRITVEQSHQRAIPIDEYAAAGCEIAPQASWPDAPKDAIIFGLKELPEDGTPLHHQHIMFGHAYKGQPAGRRLLDRFNEGGGTLYDLEYLTDSQGRRVAAFGYWAGFAGAAVTILDWAAQNSGGQLGSVSAYKDAKSMTQAVASALSEVKLRALVIGALGRVGTGATDMCRKVGIETTGWDIEETAHGGPFPEILEHDLFFNCILARPGTPVFVPATAPTQPRNLRVIGDIACDPDSAFSPIKIYENATSWDNPVVRVHDNPVLDVMAIDNLPSLLPRESSEDFASQLLPHLADLGRISEGVWARAKAEFLAHR